MTISSTTRKAGPFVGNDSSSAFPFAFKVFQAADVYVVRLDTDTNVETVLALTTDYTISLNADQNATPGGTVTLVAGALATGFNLTITSSISPLQSTDLTNQGGFYPSVITNALDKLTILIQQILERLGRSLTLPLSTPSNVSTALPFPEANKALAWNSAGTALANYDASQLATSILGSNTIVDRFTANGTAGPYTLSADPLTINNTMVFMSAAHQAHNTYSISGAAITFDAPVASGTVVEVVQQLAVTYPVTALTPNVVDTVNIVNGAVTDDKIAAGTITLAKLATAVQNLINGALQKSGGTMTGKITLDGNAVDALHPVPKQQAESIVADAVAVSSCLSFGALELSATGTNADVGVSAGEILVRSATGSPRLLPGVSLTINTAVSGANGLDSGALAASTWYAVWVIWDGSTTAGLISTSSTNPALPGGYTHKARVGWIRTDGSANKYPFGFTQRGRRVQYLVNVSGNVPNFPQMASGSAGDTSAPAFATVAVGNFVPPTAGVIDVLTRIGNASSVIVAPNGQFGGVGSSANPAPLSLIVNATTYGGVLRGMLVLESSNLYWACVGVGGGVVCCVGWEDNL